MYPASINVWCNFSSFIRILIGVLMQDNPMVVPVCSRSKDIVEPIIKPQWWVLSNAASQCCRSASRWCGSGSCLSLMRIRILLVTYADPDPVCHFDEDPDPTFHFDAVLDPDPQLITLMRIRIPLIMLVRILSFNLMRIGIHNTGLRFVIFLVHLVFLVLYRAWKCNTRQLILFSFCSWSEFFHVNSVIFSLDSNPRLSRAASVCQHTYISY